MKNSEQPTFPITHEVLNLCGEKPNPFGLTKREYFVGQILAGIDVSSIPQPDCTLISHKVISLANEIINQLENSKP